MLLFEETVVRGLLGSVLTFDRAESDFDPRNLVDTSDQVVDRLFIAGQEGLLSLDLVMN